MNVELLEARHEEIVAEMRQLVDDYQTRDDDFSDDDQARFEELDAEAKKLAEDIEKVRTREKAIAERHTAVEKGHDTRNRGLGKRVDRWDPSDLRWDVTATELRDRARAAVEEDEHLPDDNKERALDILRSVDRRGELATLILMTGHPAYRSGFPKVVSGQEWAMTDDERAAVSRAQSVGTDGEGGFAVPFTLDPTIVLTNDGAINPMRLIAGHQDHNHRGLERSDLGRRYRQLAS